MGNYAAFFYLLQMWISFCNQISVDYMKVMSLFGLLSNIWICLCIILPILLRTRNLRVIGVWMGFNFLFFNERDIEFSFDLLS